MIYARIIGGVVGPLRPESEKESDSVLIPHYARTGDLWNNGDPLKPDGTAYSDTEKQVTFYDPLDVMNALTDAEVDGLWDAAAYNVPSPQRIVARRVLMALSTASEIRSRSAQTKALVAAAVGYGFVTAERARLIFQDEGVV